MFFQPLSNLTCITNLGRIKIIFFKLSRPQGQIIEVKCEKSQKGINQPFTIFFSPLSGLLNLSENYLTNLGNIVHEKLFKLSCPQVNVNAAAAELPLQ